MAGTILMLLGASTISKILMLLGASTIIYCSWGMLVSATTSAIAGRRTAKEAEAFEHKPVEAKKTTGEGRLREHLKVLLGIGLTWTCVFIFYNGLTHATLEGAPFIFPVFEHENLLFLISAPIAQSAFYILARKTSWLLNIFLAISVIGCAVAWWNLTNGGYRYNYWHQGDLLCRHGCDDIWMFSYLVLVQGCILMFSSSVFEDFSDFWRGVLKVILIAVLLWLVLTSFLLMISM
jgi:hypothetical protein